MRRAADASMMATLYDDLDAAISVSRRRVIRKDSPISNYGPARERHAVVGRLAFLQSFSNAAAPCMHYAAHDFEQRTYMSRVAMLCVLANPIDCDAFDLWCRKHLPGDVIETIDDLDVALEKCRLLHPRLLIVDPAVNESSVARSLTAVQAGAADHLLILDRWPREGLLAEVLAEPAASYLSRMISPAALAAAIRAILDCGTRAIDPALTPRLRRTTRGLTFQGSPGAGSVAGLSARERQVMQLLAQGKTVRQCAAALGLAHSTIDNHKARLMKKLGVHKASQLTCRAVREGLIAL